MRNVVAPTARDESCGHSRQLLVPGLGWGWGWSCGAGVRVGLRIRGLVQQALSLGLALSLARAPSPNQLLAPRNQPSQHSAQKLPWWPTKQEALPWSAPPAHALVPHGHATAMVGAVLTRASPDAEPSLQTSETVGDTPSGR